MTKHPAFVAAVIVTVLWISAVFWWLSNSPIATADNCSLPHALCAIRQLDLNAAGDFLAGTFSVLAFLWLATAVLLQGSELERQRKEFVASRLEIAKQTEMLAQSADLQGRLIEDSRLVQDVKELLDVAEELWPQRLAVNCAGIEEELVLPKSARDLSTDDKVERALHDFARQLRGNLEPIVQGDAKIDMRRVHIGLIQSTRIIQSKARQVLSKQASVSLRYQSSRLFSNAALIDSLCELIFDPDHRTGETN